MHKFYLLGLVILLSLGNAASAQVLNPDDPVITYNPNAPVATPPWGTISKWVRTVRNEVNFSNKDSYKCYYLSGMPFRLKFPKTYKQGITEGKKYPIMIFLHGKGESGGIYDNEFSLYHGGGKFCAAVDNGQFDGFILVPQSTTGFFGNPHFDFIKQVLDTLIKSNNLDENRIFVNGLSAGGTETWQFMFRYPKVVAGFLPISGCSIGYKDQINTFKYIPMWIFQGGQDNNPYPGTTEAVVNAALAAGANVKETLYPNGGHGIWDNAWVEPDFWPFLNRQFKSNPWPLHGHYEFCPGEAVDATLGLTAGFDGYEWRKNGIVISGANSNELHVTSFGTYDARIKRGSTWSPWSLTPVVVKIKEATQTPPIAVSGLMSNVLPAADGKNFVTLSLPEGYTSYLWQKVGDTAVLSTAQTFNANTPGQYHAKVTEQYGCSSAFSDPYTVVNANGTNAPSAASGLSATAISKVAVTLDWVDRPNPAYNETGYEIYRAVTAGGPYTLVAITAANTVTYTDQGLNPNSKYFYVVRAVNGNGAAAISNEANAQTQVDNTAPSAPRNLTVTGTSYSSVSLSWDESTDDVGVYKYDIYINGIKSYTVEADETDFTAYNLNKDTLYTFVVKARDIAGNSSARSNQASSTAKANGLNYRYYTGSWSALPDFNTLTPAATGTSDLPDVSVSTQEDNFGFVWEGYIRIPVTGNYTFITNSDDGSKLWIDTKYDAAATPLVNNDGLHGAQDKEGTAYLTAGMHKIAMAFFEAGGGQSMTVSWKNTASGVGAKQQIPASFFKDTTTSVGAIPKAPGHIQATALSYNKIGITWADSSNNETGFEIYRAAGPSAPFDIIATTGANKTSYVDSGLVAQTTYYYRVKAINKYGDSGFNPAESGGLQYSLYAVPTSISALPDFSTLTPVRTGTTENVTLDVRDREDYFALKFAGYISISTNGTYTFYTASDDGSKLYIGGFNESNLVVNNDYLQGVTERSGTKVLAPGRYPIYVTYFEKNGGQELTVRYQGPGITKQVIPNNVFANPAMQATTLALPQVPAAPTSLIATALSSNKIRLTWNDNSANEAQFEIYRSVNDSSNFRLLTSIDSSSTAQKTYNDSALLANVKYYYKVRAKNEGGTSGYTNTVNAITLNSAPVITQLVDRSVRYGTQLVLNVTATDPDGEAVAFTATNIPSFGTFSNNGNGSATLTFTPSAANQGVYSNITVAAADQHSGTATTSFTLSVNDNYTPVIGTVSNITLNENTTSTVTATASDNNAGDSIRWYAQGLPSFATLTPSGNSVQINLLPSYTDAGVYNITLQADDGRGGIDNKTFVVTVNDVDPSHSIYVNFTDGSYPASAPWNNTNKQPVQNDLFPNLKDDNGSTTTVGIKIVSPWQALSNGSNYYGTTTGNNSGVYPDNVMKTAYWTNTTQQTFKLYGLDSNSKYSFTFFGARADVTDNRLTNYTIGATTVSLQTSKNTTNTVAINDVSPDSNNEITINLKNGTGSVYGYLNAMVVKVTYDDGNPPARPSNLAVNNGANGVALTWKDVAFNESGYEVYRADAAAGPFSQINASPVNVDAVSYTDTSSRANHQYYYTIRAINANGASAFSDTVGILTSNNNPKLDSIADIVIKNNETLTLNLHASDDPGDILSLRATGLPPFAHLTDNGDGTGSLSLTPAAGDVGKYDNISITANDNNGGSTNRKFSIYIRDKNITSVYVNFNQTLPADAPWNNFNSFPGVNAAITNMKDDAGTSTGIKIQLLDAFTGTTVLGSTTGNNSGVYPDNVIASNYYTNAATARRIRISGLAQNYRYNLIFFGSRQGNDNKNTDYTVGSNTVTLNAANNNSNTVQLNGVAADASGNIDFTVKQATGAAYGYINSVIIQYYLDNGSPLSPSGATAMAKSKSSIQLKWLDNSTNETGFEVWRSQDNTNFSLLSTVGNNVNSYTDNGLVTDSRYYYKVRALKDTIKSDFSNVVTAATFRNAVYINCNVFTPAGAPWNNTNSAPAQGLEFPNLKDDNGDNTGLTMVINKAFTGDNPYGMNTGNNSGIYPDNVISSTYWMDIGQTGELKIKGLNLARRYNFVFFASRDGSGDRTTNYTINGTTVSLNASYNTSQTVQINDVAPDQNGEVLIGVAAGGASIYGYIGALVIQSYTPELSEIDPNLIMMAKQGSSLINKDNISTTDVKVANVYPNPFDKQVTLELTNSGKGSGKNLTINITDLNGRVMYNRTIGKTVTGSQRVTVDLSSIPSGACILSVIDGNNIIKSIKLIKQ